MKHVGEAAAEPAGSFAVLWSPVGKLILLATCVYALLVATPLVTLSLSHGVLPILAGSLAATLLLAALSVALIVNGALLRLSIFAELALLVVSAGLWLGLLRLASLSHLSALLISPLATVMFLRPCLWRGRVISRLFREPSILLPVCAAAAAVDIFTVYAGPTGMMLEVNPDFVKSLSVAIPQIGSAVGEEGLAGLTIASFIGLGDFIFLAAFMGAAAKFGFNLARTGAMVLLLAAVGMTAHMVFPLSAGIPLLPFIAVGFVAANWREFQLSSAEKRAVALGALIIAILVVALWVVAQLV